VVCILDEATATEARPRREITDRSDREDEDEERASSPDIVIISNINDADMSFSMDSPTHTSSQNVEVTLNVASLALSNLESTSQTSLISPEKANGKPAGILINLVEAADSARPISVVNSFNRMKMHTLDSHSDCSIQRGEYVSPGGDDPRDDPYGDKGNLSPSRAPGSSASHSETGYE